jgi:hypothetical protein
LVEVATYMPSRYLSPGSSCLACALVIRDVRYTVVFRRSRPCRGGLAGGQQPRLLGSVDGKPP